MCGITPAHIRKLSDSPWEGGKGYPPQVVGDMTLDMVYMLLTDFENLRHSYGRVKQVESAEFAKTSEGELVKGRTADGKPMQAKIMGKSLVSRMREAKEAREKAQREQQKPRRRRRRRG